MGDASPKSGKGLLFSAFAYSQLFIFNERSLTLSRLKASFRLPSLTRDFQNQQKMFQN
jgi:hypothetical protein